MLAKKTYKNQITIPKEALKNIEDAEYFDVFTQDGNIILKPVIIQNAQEHLARIRSKIRALGMTEKDIDAAIHWTRERSS
jgi:hypothetical protein